LLFSGMRIGKRKEGYLLVLIRGKGIIATTSASLIQSHCKRNVFAGHHQAAICLAALFPMTFADFQSGRRMESIISTFSTWLIT